MKLNADTSLATLDVRGEFTAAGLEALLVELAVLRSGMEPPVTEKPPDATTDPTKPILMENGSSLVAALRKDGSFRLWLRNRGYGWIGYEVDAGRARGVAKYILSRSTDEDIDLFGQGVGQRH